MVETVLTITHVANRLGITAQTIMVYEEEGVIRLERNENRIVIAPRDVENLMIAERLRNDLGVNLAGIGVILEMREKILALRANLDRLEQEMLDRLEPPRGSQG